MTPDDLIFAGNGIWGFCKYCHNLVRLNKPILGSLHICVTESERQAIDAARSTSHAAPTRRAGGA